MLFFTEPEETVVFCWITHFFSGGSIWIWMNPRRPTEYEFLALIKRQSILLLQSGLQP
jgi:hypothetical protein